MEEEKDLSSEEKEELDKKIEEMFEPIKKLSKEESQKVENEFERTRCYLMIRHRFVHSFLMVINKRPSYYLPTMGVMVTKDGKFMLEYNPNFVKSLLDKKDGRAYVIYVLYHEIMHLALHHCTKRTLVPHQSKVTPEYIYLKQIANVAYDLALNELIPVMESCKIPIDDTGKIQLLKVSEFKKEYPDILERQTAEYYFKFLKSKNYQGCNNFDEHGNWSEHDIADEYIRKRIREIQNNDLWGTLSAGEIETILTAQEKKINWPQQLRNLVGNYIWKDKTSTRKRPNRRTGYMHPGIKKSYREKWLVAIDTSGSIHSELLARFLSVMNQLIEECPIDIMQFDAEKTSDPHLYDRKKLKFDFKGRGGTNFQPVIDICNKVYYKGLIILTDGCAEAPTKPLRAKTIWVLPKGLNPPVGWGSRIYMGE